MSSVNNIFVCNSIELSSTYIQNTSFTLFGLILIWWGGGGDNNSKHVLKARTKKYIIFVYSYRLRSLAYNIYKPEACMSKWGAFYQPRSSKSTENLRTVKSALTLRLCVTLGGRCRAHGTQVTATSRWPNHSKLQYWYLIIRLMVLYDANYWELTLFGCVN